MQIFTKKQSVSIILLLQFLLLQIEKNMSFCRGLRHFSFIPRSRTPSGDMLTLYRRNSSIKVDTETRNKKNSPLVKFVPDPFQYLQEVEVVIEDISNLGVGVGRYGSWVVMVPYTMIGETVICSIYKNHKHYSEGELVRVVVPSKDRIEPQCQYFGKCGGCQYQHITIAAQRELKRNHVISALNRIGSLNVTVNPVLGTDETFEYRTKLTPSYQKGKNQSEPIVGFQLRDRKSLLSIEKCILASPAVNTAYSNLREDVIKNYRGSNMGSLNLRETLDGNDVAIDYKSVVTQRVGNLDFNFSAGSFFQINKYALPLLVNYVINEATGSSCKYLIDAYCGCGLFALCASSYFSSIVGIEIDEKSVHFANTNAVINKITNVKFIKGDSKAIFAERNDCVPLETTVIIDPPRKGCDLDFLNQLFTFKPRRIIYISCDPATQARDSKFIVNAGYAITNVTPFDLFPQTRHIENVITFVLAS